MKISVVRSGGFAGIRREWALQVDDRDDRDEWLQLVAILPWDSRGRPVAAPIQPDRFSYRIRVSRRRITLPESELTGPWRQLVERVRIASEENRRHGDAL